MSKFYLKDWHGKEKEFTDEKIFVRGEDGELIQFTQGEGDKPAVVQPLEVTESGTYTAPDGVDGYSPVSVNVPTPEIKLQEKTITENGEYTADAGFDGLAKVLVAVAASGGSNLKIATGTIDEEKSASFTITHGLGVIPDFIYVDGGAGSMTVANKSYCCYGASSQFNGKISPATIQNCRAYGDSSYKVAFTQYTAGIENTAGYGGICRANETTASVVCSSSSKFKAGSTWIAISFGLE